MNYWLRWLLSLTLPKLKPPIWISPKVLLLVVNPTVDGLPLSRRMGWNDPNRLVELYQRDLRETSAGFLRYQIADRLVVDSFLPLLSGKTWTPEEYVIAYREHRLSDHEQADYLKVLHFQAPGGLTILDSLANGYYDELWIMAYPGAGLYESRMGGEGAFWCNAPPLKGTQTSKRRFVVMGFNYERGVGEMLEDFGHRAESILRRAHPREFVRFTQYELSHRGKANVGTIHFAPNSQRDYDWGNTGTVWCCADDWYHYPDLPNPPIYKPQNTIDWGGGDIRQHHKWWLAHLPTVHAPGKNWWWPVADPNKA